MCITLGKSGSCTANGVAKAAAITWGVMFGARPATTSSRSQRAVHTRTGTATGQSFARSILQGNFTRVKVARVVLNASMHRKAFRCAVFSIEMGEPSFLLFPVIGEGKLVVNPMTQVASTG